MAKRMVERASTRERRYKLQPRDFAMLRAVYENGFLTRGLLADLFPPQKDKKRAPPPPGGEHGKGDKAPQGKPQPKGGHLFVPLRRLYDHHYLERLIPSTTIPDEEILVYSITQHGVKALRSFYDEEFSEKGRIPYFSVDRHDRKRVTFHVIHELMIARFHIRLLAAVKGTDWQLTSWEQHDTKRKWRAEGKPFVLDPDAVFDLTNTKDELARSYFLECDRGTMTQERMAIKYHRYVSARERRIHAKEYNVSDFRVLTVTATPKRAINLAHLVAKTGKVPSKHKKHFFFAGENVYDDHPRNLLSMIWKRGDEAEERFAIVSNPPALRP